MHGIRSRHPWRGVIAAAVASALTFAMTGCGSSTGTDGGSTVGVTDAEVLIGSTQPLTGPAAPGYKRISDAMSAYFEYVNDNGGVHGRSIEFLVEDDGYDPSKTVEKTRKLVQQDKIFAMVGAFGTPTHTAVLDFLRQNKVPDLFPSSGSVSWNQPEKYPYTFGWQPDYVHEGKILAAYVRENFPGQTYCFFGQGDDQGANGLEGVEKVLGADGLKQTETYTVTNTNVSPQIGKLQSAGCEVVFSFSLAGFNSLALDTADRLGFEAQWVTGSGGADVTSLKDSLKGDPALLDGLLTNSYLPVESDSSWITMFTEINKEYNDDAPFTLTLLYGYAKAYTFVQALEAAGKDLTREGLVEVMTDGEFAGPGLLPATYTDGDHAGYAGSAISRITNGAPQVVSDVFTTDGADGPVTTMEIETTEAPEDGLPAS